MSIKHEHTLSPVTAVSFCNSQSKSPLLLAAEGVHLKVFGAEDTKLIAQCKIFREQTIHGIAVNENDDGEEALRVVIWGGPSVLIIYGCDLQAIVEGRIRDISSREFSASDWILSVALSPDSEAEFVLLTAHNSLLKANFVQNQRDCSLQTLDSPSRSILYSAHMIWESSNSITVAAGTVFGEIMVWHCLLGGIPTATELFTFIGHEGSIFGVHISPQFRDSEGNVKRLLSSCSDDRTIRLWDLSPDSIKEETNHDPVDIKTTPRGTGFGADSDSSESTTKSDERCLAIAWGHSSRIWRVRIPIFGQGDARPERIGLLSFGEDATCQLWSIDFEVSTKNIESAERNNEASDLPHCDGVQLRPCKTFAFHGGKHIWAADICLLRDGRRLVATGGADGKVSSFEISQAQLERSEAQLIKSSTSPIATDAQHGVWTLEEVLAALPSTHRKEFPENIAEKKDEIIRNGKKSKKILKDGLNRYSFVTDQKILLTTTAGRVLLGTLQHPNRVDWQELQLPNQSLDLKGYSVITSIPELELAVFAGANGNIYRYKHRIGIIEQIGNVKGKVAALFLTTSQKDKQCIHLLVTVLGSSEASLFFLHTDDASAPVKSSSVSLPPNFVLTSTGEIGPFLYLGFRNGAVGVLDPNEAANVKLTYCPPVGEDADAVTSIIEVPTTVHNSVDYVIATSRNGTYKILSFNGNGRSERGITEISMVPSHHAAPPMGSIEGAWFEGSTLYLSGFRGKQFIVWNETQQCEVTAIECGGAHRSYAYSHHQDTLGGGTFVYTKASKLYLHHQKTGSHKIVKNGGHGREIKACAVSSGNKYLATGAEDTTIRIWKYDDENDAGNLVNKRFECLAVIQKHEAGIQHLKWLGTNYLFSSGGTEEFYIWAIQEIPNFGIGVICEATLLDQSKEKDLRIMSFDILEFRPDTYFGEEWIFPEKTLLISLAYSDSTIKSYLYSKSKGFHRVAETKYTSGCLTQLRYLPYEISPDIVDNCEGTTIKCRIYLLTAGTDGHLIRWTFNFEDLENVYSKSFKPIPMSKWSINKVHQNAIKSLDLVTVMQNHYMVVTGGDDNALAFTYFGLAGETKTTIVRNAHAAAITAFTILSTSGMEMRSMGRDMRVTLVSSSNDQRVKLWDVRLLLRGNDAEVDVELIGDEFTSVADIGDMEVLKRGGGGQGDHGKIVVVGNGMDVWAV